jgi:hypothetical protein
MLRMSSLLLAFGFIVCASPKDDTSSTAQAAQTSNKVTLGVEEVASGLDQPVYVTAPASDPRLFIVEQPGRIRIVENGKLLDKPFLDIVSKVGSGGERGLLSVAFHPQYRSNGFLFVNYTDKKGDTQIERYTVSADKNTAEPRSAKLILAIDQPYSNHNGGLNLFGPDGMLYIGMGDGGSQGDPHGNGQNRNALLGKLLRLNVDRGDPYLVRQSIRERWRSRRNLGHRPAESMALLVRSFHRIALHRRCWWGSIRGSRRRPDVSRRCQLRLEHHGRAALQPVIGL